MADILERFLINKRDTDRICSIIDDLSNSNESFDFLVNSQEEVFHHISPLQQIENNYIEKSELAFPKTNSSILVIEKDESKILEHISEQTHVFNSTENRDSISRFFTPIQSQINYLQPVSHSYQQNQPFQQENQYQQNQQIQQNDQFQPKKQFQQNQQGLMEKSSYLNSSSTTQMSNIKNSGGRMKCSMSLANNDSFQEIQENSTFPSTINLQEKAKKANLSKNVNNYLISPLQKKLTVPAEMQTNKTINAMIEKYTPLQNNNLSLNSLPNNFGSNNKQILQNFTTSALRSKFTAPAVVSTPVIQPNQAYNTNYKPEIFSFDQSQSSHEPNEIKEQYIPFQALAPTGKQKIKTASNQYYTVADINEYALREHPWDKRVNEILKNVYGYTHFRNNQRAIINCVLQNKDVFAMMPTGGVQDGVYVVVMPLISLIMDQYNHMKRLNIPVVKAQGQKRNYQSELDEILFSNKKASVIVLVTPEKLNADEDFSYFLRQCNEKGKLKRFVIDEAHCVSSWGHEFRKDYLSLGQLKKQFPYIPTLALTATATEKCKIDIIQLLCMKETLYFQSSFNRSNLYYDVIKVPDKVLIEHIVSFIKEKFKNASGIIYCCTRKDAEDLAKILTIKYQINSSFYHGSMNEKEKEDIQQFWMDNDIQVICATIAFGMGIDKHDVRFVIHYTFSKSIENYYQEAGRAGRDGKPSHCRIYYTAKDKQSHIFLIANNEGSNQTKKEQGMAQLTKMIRYCEDTVTCRRVMQLAHLGEKFDEKFCNKMCDNCRNSSTFNSNIVAKDITNECRKILSLYNELMNRKVELTQKQFIQALRGLKTQKAYLNQVKILEQSEMYGLLKSYEKDQVDLIVKELISQGYLKEKLKKTGKYSVVFLEIKRPKLNEILNNQKLVEPIVIRVVQSPTANNNVSTKSSDKYRYNSEQPIRDDINHFTGYEQVNDYPYTENIQNFGDTQQEYFDQNKNLIFDGMTHIYDDISSDIAMEDLNELIDLANNNKPIQPIQEPIVQETYIQPEGEGEEEELHQKMYKPTQTSAAYLDEGEQSYTFNQEDNQYENDDEEEQKIMQLFAKKSNDNNQNCQQGQGLNFSKQPISPEQPEFFSEYMNPLKKIPVKVSNQNIKSVNIPPNIPSLNSLNIPVNKLRNKEQTDLYTYNFNKLAKH